MGMFTMPSLGADMDSGRLTDWLVAPGDEVHRGQIIAVVDTAKSAIEVEVFEDGRVGELLVEPGTQVPVGTPLAAVATYAVGMALFTIVMGNAFAAFPVMTAGIGLPLVVEQFGGDVVVVSAVGMLSGYCGTLCTPMAANYNLVPAALLELPGRHDVIRAQLPTAAVLLAANIGILWWAGLPH